MTKLFGIGWPALLSATAHSSHALAAHTSSSTAGGAAAAGVNGPTPHAAAAAGSSSSADQQQLQEPDISIYDGPFVYDGFAHGAIATAANSQDFVVSGSFTYTYNGSSDPPTNAGSYAVVATFTSNDPNFSNGTETSTMVIAPATPRITLTGGTFGFDANPHPAVATDVGIDGVTPVSGSFSFTYNGSSTPPTNPGSYAVVASFTSADPNYANTSATTTISINTIPTGVTVTGASTTSVTIAWNPVLEPAGATPTYNIYEKVLHSGGGGKGSHGGYYTYNLVASGLTTASATITGLTAARPGGIAPSHSYVVTSVLNGVSSPYSTLNSGAPLYAPALNSYFLLNGFVWYGNSPLNVTVGQTVQLSVSGYGNPMPTFSLGSGPSFVSIDPNSGVISISPTAADVGNFTATFAATNSLGSVTSPSLSIHVLALPTVVVTGGTVVFDGNTHGASAVAHGPDGVTPLAGTFSFQYAPVQVPTALSSGEYAEVGSYIVQATFNSSDPNYGNAVGTGTLAIVPATPAIIVDGTPISYDGASHAAVVTAVGADGVTPVGGSFVLTYNGSANLPSATGTYTVSTSFTSSDPNYNNTVGTGSLTIVPATPTIIIDGGPFTDDGTAHAAMVTALAVDGVSPVAGSLAVTYNGSAIPPSSAGSYAVSATFTTGDSNYASTTTTGTLVIGGSQTAPAVSVTVGSTGAVVLDGSTVATGNTTNITNNSTSANGVLVTGVNQVVGGIDGAGNIVVNSGASLTANHIVQGSLVIGGDATNPATVTIAASDSAGNPLVAAAVTSSGSSGVVGTAAVESGGVSAAGSPVESTAVATSAPLAAGISPSGSTSTETLGASVPSGSSPSFGWLSDSALPSPSLSQRLSSSRANLDTAATPVLQVPNLSADVAGSSAAARTSGNSIAEADLHAAAEAVFESGDVTTTAVDDSLLDLIAADVGQDAPDQLTIRSVGHHA
ncbi:MAG TPA: MBG domain-containing protein [Pirellulales bacterium]|nr:MBG domain-containing protein [Pirellulales bacterium]